MLRHGSKRAVFAAGAVAIANSRQADAAVPSTDGITSVRATGAAADTTRRGFVADENGRVVAYVGSAANQEELAGTGFAVRISEGTELVAMGVAFEGAAGLAMMRLLGSSSASCELLRDYVETLRTVYGATTGDTTGEIATVRDIDPAPETDPGRAGRISPNSATGERGFGLPPSNNCGDVTRLIVRNPSPTARVNGLAEAAARLEDVLAGRGLVLARTAKRCVTGTERSDVAGQARGEAEEGQA